MIHHRNKGGSVLIRKIFVATVFACISISAISAGAETSAVSAGYEGVSADELTRLGWDALGKEDHALLENIYSAALKAYEPEAMAQHAGLSDFPVRDRIDEYKVMNDVATLHFVRLESLRAQGKTEEAVALAREIIKAYPFAQSWDPSRGGFWSIAEKSQIIMDQLTGATQKIEDAAREMPLTRPVLAFPGKDKVVDYTKYGKFKGIGTRDYDYQMGNPSKLAAAVGEGIYPNTSDVLKAPQFRQLYKEGRLKGSHWDMVNTRDLEAAFYKWATATEEPGVKLYYTGLVLERAGLYLEAVKAYHACVVHFPKSFGMTYWQTPWYPAQAAVGKILNILRFHPELNLSYTGGLVRIENSTDKDTDNDVFFVNPGVLKHTPGLRGTVPKEKMVRLGSIKRRLGGKKTQFVQHANGHWRMLVDGKPFIIKGVTYTPTKIGQTPDKNTLENWMFQADDSMHKAWVDKNRNNVQDPDEPAVGDFQLMKDMGVNTIRLYNNLKMNKELLRELYSKYGIMVMLGDYLGKYAIGSGADWKTGTDYEDPVQQATMMKNVLAAVTELKDEPFILMWLLGNENNYGVASNADRKPDVYYKFVNEVALKIKELDPTRPVAVCNGDTLFIDRMAELSPDVDAYGANAYRGDYGFGSYWDEVYQALDRPAFITEYGAPAYSKYADEAQAEDEQAAYHLGSWHDIMANSAGRAEGRGNAVGGVAFEWLDEWWKNYEPFKHDTKSDVIGPFAGGYYFEEWFGLIAQGDGSHSPLMRQPRKAYDEYRKMWKGK
jgi:beta-glucuronidase